jgi:hypothetical protein
VQRRKALLNERALRRAMICRGEVNAGQLDAVASPSDPEGEQAACFAGHDRLCRLGLSLGWCGLEWGQELQLAAINELFANNYCYAALAVSLSCR